MDRTAVVILLSDRERAVAIAKGLSSPDREVRFAAGIDDLQRLIHAGEADVLIVEDHLSGLFRGLEILDRLQDDLLRPPTILLVDAHPEISGRIAKAEIEYTLPPDASIAEVVSAVATASLERRARRPPVCQVARHVVRDLGRVERLPAIVLKLADRLEREEMSVAALASAVGVSATATAELLSFAHAERSTKTISVYDAIEILGVQRSMSLLVISGLFRAKELLFPAVGDELRQWHGCRSLLIASVAASFAAKFGRAPSEVAYLSGFLQDVGVLVLAQNFNERYGRLLNRRREAPQLRLKDLEQAEFSTSHAAISAALLQKWGLPDIAVESVLRHHDDADATACPPLLQCMRIGEAVADLFDHRCRPRFLALNELLSRYGLTDRRLCLDALEDGVSRALESCRLFEIPLPSRGRAPEMLAAFESWSDQVAGLQSHGAIQPEPTNARQIAKKVLLIEDEESIARYLQIILSRLGLEMALCDNLDEARRWIGDVDSVVCDVHLGDENGIDIARALRADGFQGPIVMISGDNDRATIQAAIAADVDAYLVKPFSPELLLKKLTHRRPSFVGADVASSFLRIDDAGQRRSIVES